MEGYSIFALVLLCAAQTFCSPVDYQSSCKFILIFQKYLKWLLSTNTHNDEGKLCKRDFGMVYCAKRGNPLIDFQISRKVSSAQNRHAEKYLEAAFREKVVWAFI